MNTFTCDEAAERLDLYAAGECDAAERAAVEGHLAGCPACAAEAAEARRLLALLDQRFQEPERLKRLHDRLKAEARPKARAPRALPFVQRVAALAAALLLALGLGVFFRTGQAPEFGGERLAMSLRLEEEPPSRAVPDWVKAVPPPAVERLHGDAEIAVARLDLHGKSADSFRHALKEEARTGRLPPPPKVRLTLKVTNRGPKAVALDAADPRTELKLELSGPGVMEVEAPPDAAAGLIVPRRLLLEPGETKELHVQRLASLERGQVRYLYWTEPGEYTLHARLRALLTPLTGTAAATTATAEAGPAQVRVKE
jgi:hypothetical protein